MSKTVSSDRALWLQDTPLPPRTSTTSDGASLTVMEKSTGIGVERQLVWAVLVSVVVSALVSPIVTFLFLSRMDGQRWLGWTSQDTVVKGKHRRVMIPLFMTPEDLKDLQENP